MTRAKVLLAAVVAALTIGGVAPVASATERSIGQTINQQLTNVTEGPAGRAAFRVLQRALDAA